MEIPYTVRNRPDTGLYNAKVGIWLFLASEVMLFGGLFSGYIFLRLKAGGDAEYFWPENALKVWPGFINTIILILSSVTVLLSWFSLKNRNWRGFQIYMGLTIICALLFLCLKTYEYSGKFKHYGFLMNDGSRVEAHIDGDPRTEYAGLQTIAINPETVDLRDLSNSFVHGISPMPGAHHGEGHDDHEEHATEKPFQFRLADAPSGSGPFTLIPTELKKLASDLETRNAAVLEEWKASHSAEDLAADPLLTPPAPLEHIQLVPVGDVSLKLPSKRVKGASETSLELRDGTKIEGTRLGKFFELHVDKIDLRVNAVRAADRVAEADRPEAIGKAIAKSRALELLGDEVKKDFIKYNEKSRAEFREEFPGYDEYTQHEALRLAYMMPGKKLHHYGKDGDSHPHMTLSDRDVKFWSNLTPKYNTYYAIYFTLTGLHGLHVLGGIIVLSYFLFRGKKLYDKNPEHMANRVEVAGLFWHFVDLVWIFLFPIMYLL